MKKFILGIAILICYSTMAQEFEANIKAGYDFYRSSTVINEQNNKNVTTRKYGNGFVIGLELLPLKFKNDKIKLGVGFEYNFGDNNVKYKVETTSNEQHPIATMIPVYATAKFTYYRPKNIDLNLYTFARLGYAFAREESTHGYPYYRKPNTGGVYYGLGLGIDYKYFLAEILYDGKYNRNLIQSTIQSAQAYDVSLLPQDKNNFAHELHHKIGVRLGLQLGTQHFKKAQIESKIVEVPKVVEKIVEVEKVVEKKTTNKIIIKHFDISAEALFGFNKYKLSDLKEGGKQEIEEKVKELLKSGFEITGINVIGHTDRLGTDAYNYKLGLNRANTIGEYLKELGIKVEIKSSSKGKTEPKVHCNNVKSTSKLKDCLQPNRRVELQFLGTETQQKIEEVIETR